MFCIIEIMCLVMGVALLIIVLTSGSFPMGAGKELRGTPAFVSAGLLMAVLPIGVLIACAIGGFKIHQGEDVDDEDWRYLLIDIGVIVGFGLPAMLVAILGAKPIRKKKKKKKKRRPEEEDYDDYDRRSDDDRPSRRRNDDDDDDEDRPRRRRRDDDDEDEPPRRRYDEGSGSHRRRRRLDEDED